MFQRILYPSDFSEGSNNVLPYLIQLKAAGIEEVVILHVVDTRHLRIPEIYKIIDVSLLGEKQATAAKKKAAEPARKLKAAGIKTRVRIEKGIPFQEIIRVAEEDGVSMIVIGSHGTSNVKEMLLGSVVEKVVRKARKPVLVIKG